MNESHFRGIVGDLNKILNIKYIDITDQNNYEIKHNHKGILIFSDEWLLKHKQCLNHLKSLSGEYSYKTFARKCRVVEIDKTIAKNFLDENHIQGSNNLAVVFFGLYCNNELLGVLSLGRHSRQISANRIVLDRMCFKDGHQVVGGASKLFSRAIQWAKDKKYDEIISFSDNRWTVGKIYEILGFKLEKEYKPDYSYVDVNNPTKRISKQSQKKSDSGCPKDITEFEWAKRRGLRRIWDSGKKRWVYHLDPNKISWNEVLSKKCAKQHSDGVFKHSHQRGYFKSIKNNKEIYYGSSYELRCLFLLENNSNVKSFERCEIIRGEKGWRNPDIKVELNDGIIYIYEVKPKARLSEASVIKQINDSQYYADKNGYKLYVWTEDDSLLPNEKSIISWAKKYSSEILGHQEFTIKQHENNKKRSKKYYDNVIALNKIVFDCSFCNIQHEVLKINYEKNLNRNGRYICEREGGHITGIKPKPHLLKENPYAREDKKECRHCKKILPFDSFGKDKSRRDGYADVCKEDRRELAKKTYKQTN